jgi:hypothetical protein
VVAYALDRSNRNNELRVTNIATGDTKVTAFGSQPVFSSDSQWIAYSVGQSEAQQDKLRKDKKPIHSKLGLLNLSKGSQITFENIDSFSFSPDGGYLAMRRYAPEKSAQPPESTPDSDPPPNGATLIVRDLVSARDSSFGNVAEYVWQDLPKTGRLLAITVSAEEKMGNGVQLFDPKSASLRVLDSSASVYSRLAWRKKSADLAVLRSVSDEQHNGPTHVVMAWTHLSQPAEAAHQFDPASGTGIPPGMRIVAYRQPSWSDDAGLVYVGFPKWEKAPPKKSKDDQQEDQPAVDVWHWRDSDVMAKQKIGARSDRQMNMLAAWQISSNQIVPLSNVLTERVVPLKSQKLAYAVTWTPYAMDRSIGRPAISLWSI